MTLKTTMLGILISSIFLRQYVIIALTPVPPQIPCFVRSTSTARRDVIQIIPGGLNEIACQIICTKDDLCSAIQLTTTGNCVIFGAEITATYGQCPAPFTCMLKTYTGCIPKPRRPIDLGYIGHYCSGPVLRAPADDGTVQPCGDINQPPFGKKYIYIDALQHDGTNRVLENYNNGHMAWDEGFGSWYMLFRDDPYFTRHYFLAAKCVGRPVTIRPECECEQLPTGLPVMAGWKDPKQVDIDPVRVCPDNYVQLYYLNIYEKFEVGAPQYGVVNFTNTRWVYCANRVWMQLNVNLAGDMFNSYILTAASCLTLGP